MKIWFILVLFACVCVGCGSGYIADVDRVTGKQADRICKEENISLVGSGGAMMDCITKIKLCFDATRRVDVNEARRLEVKCIEEIRAAVNAKESLMPYLNPYPFPASGMEVGIMFRKPKGGFVEYGCAYLGKGGVSSTHQVDGTLFYSSFNPRTGHLEPYYEEPYEVALAIVRGELPAPVISCKDPNKTDEVDS